MSMNRRPFRSVLSTAIAGCVVVLCVLLVLYAGGRVGGAEPGDPAVARTDAGPVRGTVADDARIFQGIPYAAPPVGELRWKPPEAVQPWSMVRDATTPASPCPQQANSEVPKPTSDEDCLYLNVTTPRAAAHGPRPVLVWMAGGGFLTGAGSSYGARRLAAHGDVVVVTINYRLGIFGFFGHAGLADSGSFGLQDQQAALRWVQRNASAFGGDPGNVTLAGQSAGAMSTCAQLTSPSSVGLFHKTVMQSGSCASDWPRNGQYPGQDAGSPWLPQSIVRRTGNEIGNQLGCKHPDALACLRRLPANKLLKQTLSFSSPAFGTNLLPQEPGEALRSGRFHRMPTLSGNNRDDARSYVAAFSGGKIDAAGYRRLLTAMVGETRAPKVQSEYPLSRYDSPAIAWGAVTTDRIWSCTQVAADHQLARRVPTYAYEFADAHSPLTKVVAAPIPLGAAHAMELPYLFALGRANLPLTQGQRQLSEQMIAYWTAFARSADPNGPGRPDWSRVRAGASGLSLAPAAQGDIQPVNLTAEHHCRFWNRLT
jgi:para-nitrobenzyl esterase